MTTVVPSDAVREAVWIAEDEAARHARGVAELRRIRAESRSVPGTPRGRRASGTDISAEQQWILHADTGSVPGYVPDGAEFDSEQAHGYRYRSLYRDPTYGVDRGRDYRRVESDHLTERDYEIYDAVAGPYPEEEEDDYRGHALPRATLRAGGWVDQDFDRYGEVGWVPHYPDEQRADEALRDARRDYEAEQALGYHKRDGVRGLGERTLERERLNEVARLKYAAKKKRQAERPSALRPELPPVRDEDPNEAPPVAPPVPEAVTDVEAGFAPGTDRPICRECGDDIDDPDLGYCLVCADILTAPGSPPVYEFDPVEATGLPETDYDRAMRERWGA